MEIPEVNPYPSGSAHAAHAVFTAKTLRDNFRIKDCRLLCITPDHRGNGRMNKVSFAASLVQVKG
jgi:hypothetical protein